MATGGSSASRAPGRPDRPSVLMPCPLELGGARLSAQLVDIGYGGIGLTLPDTAERIEPGMLFHAAIEGLGVAEVECRWRRGNRIGAQFKDEDALHGKVEAFLKERSLSAE